MTLTPNISTKHGLVLWPEVKLARLFLFFCAIDQKSKTSIRTSFSKKLSLYNFHRWSVIVTKMSKRSDLHAHLKFDWFISSLKFSGTGASLAVMKMLLGSDFYWGITLPRFSRKWTTNNFLTTGTSIWKKIIPRLEETFLVFLYSPDETATFGRTSSPISTFVLPRDLRELTRETYPIPENPIC